MYSESKGYRIDQSDYLKLLFKRRITRAGDSIVSIVATQTSSTGGSKT